MTAEEYVSDDEYPTYFSKLEGLRARIAAALPVKPGMRILDLAAGYGYFAVEVAKREKAVKVVGIDVSQRDVDAFRRNVERLGLGGRLEAVEMDATQMAFPDASFDMAVNFLGLEDIHMTRGKDGVHKAFAETARVLKAGGYFCFAATPPEESETRAQELEAATFSYLCDCTWLAAREYENILANEGFELLKKERYHTGKKLTAAQAAEEVRFACDNVPRIYGVRAASFDDVWSKFGTRIEKHGLGHYSKVALFVARKVARGQVG
jgi:ubiquinone/menaquinone biosynthesis C-methylase UbiE